jgi:proteasome lid subunit RPN8/RPN11
MNTMVVIDQMTVEQLKAYCRSTLPEEACGALEGFVRDEEVYISGFIPVTNRAFHPSVSFTFDAEEWVELVLKREHSLIGTFHSHPAASAYPSQADLLSAWPHFPVHLILSMKTEEIFAYNQTKNHSTAKQRDGEWFNGLNIRISPRA